MAPYTYIKSAKVGLQFARQDLQSCGLANSIGPHKSKYLQIDLFVNAQLKTLYAAHLNIFHLRHSCCAAVHGIEDSKGHAATAADANELICISKAKLLSMSSRPIRKLQSRSLQLPLAQVPQHSLLPAQVSGQEVYAV